ncbi:hypothetical protein GQX74_011410 [Glossina fuscipes]|nr:hypothetical protein GQX74_011410 [Glossina fuscipes]
MLCTCKAEGLAEIMSEASFKALEDFISPSAAITLARASLAASASAAIALCKAVGKETSLLRKERRKSSSFIKISLMTTASTVTVTESLDRTSCGGTSNDTNIIGICKNDVKG